VISGRNQKPPEHSSTFTPYKMRTAQTGSKTSFNRVAVHQDFLTAEFACGAV